MSMRIGSPNFQTSEQTIRNAFREARRTETGRMSDSMKELSTEEIAKRRMETQNKPVTLRVGSDEITANRFSQTADNVTYDVGGVTFSNREMSNLKEIARSAISLLPAMGSDLDYNAYASIGLTANLMSAYASEYLTDAQRGVALKSMEDYANRLISAQSGDWNQASGAYYGMRRDIPESAADNFGREIATDDKLPDGVKSTLLKNLSHAKTVGVRASAATNIEVANGIREAFSNVNLRDGKAVASLLERYRADVTPAYREWGLGDKSYDTSLAAKLSNDTALFSKQIARVLSALDRANETEAIKAGRDSVSISAEGRMFQAAKTPEAKSLTQSDNAASGTGAEESESVGGSVGINAVKLARKLAAAKTQSQIRAIMAEIQSDLRECESGKAQGMDVDEASVEAAERLLQEARQRMGQTENREPTPEEEMASALASLF